MARRSLAEQYAELDDPTPKGSTQSTPSFLNLFCIANMFSQTDFDPEDLDRGDPDSDDESSREVDEDAGREHYQAVG